MIAPANSVSAGGRTRTVRPGVRAGNGAPLDRRTPERPQKQPGARSSKPIDLPQQRAVDKNEIAAPVRFAERGGGRAGGVQRAGRCELLGLVATERPGMHPVRALDLPGGRGPALGICTVDDCLLALGGFDDQRRIRIRSAAVRRTDFDRFAVGAGRDEYLGTDVAILLRDRDLTGIGDRGERGVGRAVFIVVGGIGAGSIDVENLLDPAFVHGGSRRGPGRGGFRVRGRRREEHD